MGQEKRTSFWPVGYENLNIFIESVSSTDLDSVCASNQIIFAKRFVTVFVSLSSSRLAQKSTILDYSWRRQSLFFSVTSAEQHKLQVLIPKWNIRAEQGLQSRAAVQVELEQLQSWDEILYREAAKEYWSQWANW